MKQGLLRITIALVLCALLGGAALGNVKSRNVRFDDNVTVGGTLLKKGSYKVSFDDQTNELTIKRGSKVVVKTAARLEEYKSTGTYAPEYKTREAGAGNAALLTSVNLGGAFAVIGDSAGAPSGNMQQ